MRLNISHRLRGAIGVATATTIVSIAGIAQAVSLQTSAAPMQIRHSHCSLILPLHWVSAKPWDGEFDITQYGTSLDRIRTDFMLIRDLPGTTPASLTGPEKLYNVAERFLARSPPDVGAENREVRSLTISQATRRPMFDIELAYWSDFAEYRERVVGWIERNTLFTIQLDAPSLYYFAHDMPAFEATIASVCAGQPP